MSRERRKRAIRDQVQDTFGSGGELPPADRTGRILEALVAFVLGTGFWRLVVSDSWVTSAVFGVVLAALLLSYSLFRSRVAEKGAGPADGDPPHRHRPD